MQIEILTLCRDAIIDTHTLIISGIGRTNMFIGKTLPVKITLSVVLKIRFETGDGGKHKLELSLKDADMQPVIINGKALGEVKNINVQIENSSLAYFHIGKYNGVLFEKPGDYCFELKVDGETMGQIPLYLRQKI